MGVQGNKGFLFFRVFRAFRGQGVLDSVEGCIVWNTGCAALMKRIS